MAPAKVVDDPVAAEYDVYITHAPKELIYLVQYPNRPRHRPYDNAHGVPPEEFRIKPQTGYLEADVKLNAQHNFNKYMGLKWGDASKISKDLHNSTGTFGPASGLTMARPRALLRSQALKDDPNRELEIDNDLARFDEAQRDGKVLNTQTLGGQIIQDDAAGAPKKGAQFVGAFRGDQLHLTKVSGVAQLRPQFHHVDAEAERMRIAVTRAQHDLDPPVPSAAFTVKQRVQSEAEKNTLENRMRKKLLAAEHEPWMKMEYVHEERGESYRVYLEQLFVQDVENTTSLKSPMDNEQYLDAISAPRHNNPTRRRRRPPKRKDVEDVEDVEMEDAQPGAAVAG